MKNKVILKKPESHETIRLSKGVKIKILDSWGKKDFLSKSGQENYSLTFIGTNGTNITYHTLEITRYNKPKAIKPIPKKLRSKARISATGPLERTLIDTNFMIVASDGMDGWPVCEANFANGLFKYGVFFTGYGAGYMPKDGNDIRTAEEFKGRFSKYFSKCGKEIKFDDFKVIFDLRELPAQYKSSINSLL
ncbi:hypothetical protein HYW74_02970 [Candidatus Pacearchaeota archaeon]|nr:hypothetical protein [Candidatus Pacearchaeota archaeon]